MIKKRISIHKEPYNPNKLILHIKQYISDLPNDGQSYDNDVKKEAKAE